MFLKLSKKYLIQIQDSQWTQTPKMRGKKEQGTLPRLFFRSTLVRKSLFLPDSHHAFTGTLIRKGSLEVISIFPLLAYLVEAKKLKFIFP